MTIQMTVSADGERLVTMTEDEYQDLLDGRHAEAVMRGIAAGTVETLGEAEVDAYLAAPTPLAFWRKYRGLTQQQLADAIDVSQPYIAQLENGQREAMGSVYVRLAAQLRVRVDDLLVEPAGD
jgi:DNA-binding XRE family transcriptional regulator